MNIAAVSRLRNPARAALPAAQAVELHARPSRDFDAKLSLPEAKTTSHWFWLSGIDTAAAPGSYAILALGDSITDGSYNLRLEEYTLGDEISITTSHKDYEDKTISLVINSPEIKNQDIFLNPISHK